MRTPTSIRSKCGIAHEPAAPDISYLAVSIVQFFKYQNIKTEMVIVRVILSRMPILARCNMRFTAFYQ